MTVKSFKRWKIGAVTITRIVETPSIASPQSLMYPGEIESVVQPHVEWLAPHFLTPDGEMLIAWQCFVVETPSRRIMVDTCIGNDRKRHFDIFNDMHNAFIEDLIAAGYPPETIDTVMCTHLHYDHVGWNTHLAGGKWIPTFPNARYLFGRDEWESIQTLAAEGDWHAEHLPDSLQPIVDAGLADFVETNHRLCDEVWFEPTSGHTPGHASVHIFSEGEEAVITGDLMHHPVQCAIPHKHSAFDHDKDQACRTRVSFLSKYEGGRALIVGSHFPGPTAGYVVRAEKNWRFDIDRPEPRTGIPVSKVQAQNHSEDSQMTTQEKQNEHLVVEFFETLSSGNLEALRSYIDDDTTWEPMVSENVPGAGVHKGNAIVDEFIGPVRNLFVSGDPKVKIHSLVAAGEKVMCETRASGALSDGRRYDNVYAWAFAIRNGRIKEIREYMDSAYVAQLFGTAS
ncbi:hypothetical protein CIC12_20350 [Burkholderia sp. SG-MS1]|uniref:MBL fold metallo-hydrolase n=1 Tax=Paraburkholderia sp. SG-MS1 TaxID=2023741 RepID=UPI001445D155|nr:MBL fold metallo-hydrolase [Paraburkholderia sp. SG-MS1]NKJ49044.1 hypothetical protein [Paraburkholderia sp. SG-MS1]